MPTNSRQIVNGVTYFNKDIEAREKAEEIKSAMNADGNVIAAYAPESSGYIGTDGSFVSNNTYKATDYIPVNPMDGSMWFSGKLGTVGENYYNIWAYDETRTGISGVYRAEDDEYHTVKLVIPNKTRFLRIVTSATLAGEQIAVYNDGGLDTLVLDNIESLQGERWAHNLIDTSALSNGYINGNGAVSSMDAYKTTDYLPVDPNRGDVLLVGRFGAMGATFYHVWAYADNKSPICGVLQITDTTEMVRTKLSLPPNTKYIRAVNATSKKDLFAVYYIPFDAKDQVTSGEVLYQNALLYGFEDMRGTRADLGMEFADGKLVQQHDTSGSAWWTINIEVGKLTNNIIRVETDFEELTGSGRLYVFGKRKSDPSLDNFITIEMAITGAGKHDWTIDLNNLNVYQNLNLTTPVSIGIANNTSAAFKAVYKYFNVYDYVIDDGDKKSLNKKLYALQQQILQTVPKEEISLMVSPNGTKYRLTVANDGTLETQGIVPTGKVLFMGNSLTAVWGFGMAASDRYHDWVYYVQQKITELNSSITFDRLFSTAFEDCTTEAEAESWMENTLDSRLTNNVSMVYIQLGDNVAVADTDVFRKTSKSLIRFIQNKLPGVRVMWLGIWYSRSETVSIVREACAQTGAEFVDITDIRSTGTESAIGNVVHKNSSETWTYTIDNYTDNVTDHELTIEFTVNGKSYISVLPYASYTTSGSTITVTGEYYLIDNAGVASHPGDTGHLAIANAVAYKSGFTDAMNEINMNEN